MNKSKKLIFFFIFLNCFLTFFNQIFFQYTPSADSLRYLLLAKQYTDFDFFDPTTNCYGHPFYALFLSIIGTLFSYHHFIIGLIQSLIFCSSAILLIREVEKLIQKNLNGLICLLFLVPEIHFHNGYLTTESLAYSLIFLSFYAALVIHNHHLTLSKLFLLSFIISIAVLNRLESAVIIFPIVYLIYPDIKTKMVTNLLIIFSCSIVLIQLNGFRNYRTFQTYKLSAFNGGEVIYGGNNDNLDGSHHPFCEYKTIFLPKDKIDGLNKILLKPECEACPERDSFFLALAIDAWKKDPMAQIKVIPDKLAKNWLLPGDCDIYTFDTTKTKGLQIKNYLSKENFNNARMASYKHLFYLIIHWALLLMLILGIYRINHHNRFQMSVLILLGFYLLFAIPFCGLPRWHVAVFPIMIVAFTPSAIVVKINKIMNL